MKLEPEEQWICDVCGEVIEKPEDGYLQWRMSSNSKIEQFAIVHHISASPRRTLGGCYLEDVRDLQLDKFLGVNGIVRLQSLIDSDPFHRGQHYSKIEDIQLWLEIYRRLYIPYYEEARQYWEQALKDNYFDEMNELIIYYPENLKKMIEHYEIND
ncbi:MAG: hypothetical protein KIB11_10365 [Clostridium perfringens]|nr:hypothetical protein [Clostridium perfringens]